MADKYIYIDPDGDTLIILPCIQPTNETDDTAWERWSLSNDDNNMDGRSSHSDEDELRSNSSLSSDDDMEDEPSVPEHMPLETLLFCGQESSETASEIASVSQVFQDNTRSNDAYYFKVSMKQLSLASPRAKAILLGPYKESIPTTDGLRHWKFEPIFDPEAFKIVMSIIHAQFHNVPDEVSLEMLSKIAVIVDDLNCRGSVHHFAKLWLKELDGAGASSHDGIYYARRIFTLWVFNLEERLIIETHHAVMHSPNISSSFGLPIPARILEALSQKRLSMLQERTRELRALIDEVRSDNSQCFLCGSAAMGALIMNVHTHRLTEEDIAARSDNMSWTGFRDTVMSFTYPKAAACKGKVKPHVNLEHRVSYCTRESGFWGLDWTQF